MWYEFATNRKMIDSMFPLGFELGKPELSSILIAGSDVKISLNCNKIPESYPKKWMEKEFNAIHVVIDFGHIVNLKYNGAGLGWIDDFFISGSGLDSEKSIKLITDTFEIECICKYLTIRNVEAYEDVRW
ncbi:Imm50 family immunity protein [Vibrio gazogenes]|uniref:Immunity protein 50 n=1 Tax=Vibrio gazogenes DSM 21264 = NBRC 103151 TaxID=1123492 RepID=A0A1M5A563_VIBGA|nr:Imm50 family immunity protein [Vibrio gazogenes]USP13354.1 immunity 50 family protein [Vibrio gazogenes]SHF25237.1 Immunity protein 50 [Vibrio gazogenes DSM 21264] [Vibrio gazogenes DSM 21264 = NBRC 103151]SJN57008.1 hypothetical protein BQ6471_02328 [Vibrio gazogenes]